MNDANYIRMHLRCVRCMEEKHTPQIEAGWTEQGIQVWCLRHEANVIHIDFEGAQHSPANPQPPDSSISAWVS